MKENGSNRRPRRTLEMLVLLALVSALGALAQERGSDAKRRSKNGLTVGVPTGSEAEITITYGRPTVRERRIWGGLVPFNKVWRAGADEATTITFTKDVEVEGSPVPAGTYALFVLPSQEEWTVILNKAAKQWGAYEYDAEQDVARVTVIPESFEHTEELRYTLEGIHVVLYWSNLRAAFAVH